MTSRRNWVIIVLKHYLKWPIITWVKICRVNFCFAQMSRPKWVLLISLPVFVFFKNWWKTFIRYRYSRSVVFFGFLIKAWNKCILNKFSIWPRTDIRLWPVTETTPTWPSCEIKLFTEHIELYFVFSYYIIQMVRTQHSRHETVSLFASDNLIFRYSV